MVSDRRGGVGRTLGPPLRVHLDPKSFADDSPRGLSAVIRAKDKAIIGRAGKKLKVSVVRFAS